MSRSTYYAKLNHEPSQRQLSNEKLSKKIKTEFFKAKQRYGAPKIHAQLLRQGERCSLKRVQKMMRKLGLRSIIMKKWKAKSSETANEVNLPNLLKQDFSAPRLNQKWTTDITYIHTQKGRLVLSIQHPWLVLTQSYCLGFGAKYGNWLSDSNFE